MSAALLIFPHSKAGINATSTVQGLSPRMVQVDLVGNTGNEDSAGSEKTDAGTALYSSLSLEKAGLSATAFLYAWKGYQQLLEEGRLSRPDVLTVCDFSQSSRRKRMYIIDVKAEKLLLNTWVAHGQNSGGEFANRFSNTNDSHQSSLGFYITRSTYTGEHGLSLKMDGVEYGFNHNAETRAIVVHGAGYIGNGSTGRSWGCPAVPDYQKERVISLIRNGSCFFIYHPTNYYLKNSKILNA